MTQPTEPHKGKSVQPALRPSRSLDDLAREQGIGPAHDLDALSKCWPADDDPDELDAFIRAHRAARRSAARNTP
jgi:hypothetical protein